LINKTKDKVYVIGPTFGIDDMFIANGYKNVYNDYTLGKNVPDIVIFTGGADISPSLYDQKIAPGTYPNLSRDKREVSLWNTYKDKKKIGICRGAQLLSSLNGGSMIQDVNFHTMGTHDITTTEGQVVLASTVHHQMIIPPKDAEVVAWTKLATTFRTDRGDTTERPYPVDPEIIWIEKDQAYCVQGHPEFGPSEFEDFFFNHVERFL
jgi:GMP synthase-like glutamine amidotransferase